MTRHVFAEVALQQVPKLLTLLDRNPHSPTYGCFDRDYWHYRIIDFPSGMAQEFVLPLALAFDTDAPRNPYHRRLQMRAWVEAGIDYAARSAHPNGSCDDYFPYEQAAGAAAFSLLACVESYELLDLGRHELLAFFGKRADWLAQHEETGRLSNHQALIALALHRTGQLLRSSQWNRDRDRLLERLLDWQSPEGWFPEYDGMDSGYQTLTLWCLARLYDDRPEERLEQAIRRSVELLLWFVHPDGSFGGEYNSRNTYNFFPAAFERVGRWMPEALSVNERFAEALAAGNAPCYADDHIIGHHTWNYLLAYRDWVEERPLPRVSPPTGRRWVRDAGLLVDRTEDSALYVALNKGGLFRYYRNGRFLCSDTQLSVRLRHRGRRRTAVGHLVSDFEIEVDVDTIRVAGPLGWAKQARMTTARLVILRLGMLTIGRWFPNLVRSALQRLLIVRSRAAPLQLVRTLKRRDGRWFVRDELTAERWHHVQAVGIGGDQTSVYVAMSRTFHPAQLQSWEDLSDSIHDLADGDCLVVERALDEWQATG